MVNFNQKEITKHVSNYIGAVKKQVEWLGKEEETAKIVASDLDAIDPAWSNYTYRNIADVAALKKRALKQDNPEFYCVVFGIAERIKTAANDTGQKMQNLRRWGIAYEGSKAYNPDSAAFKSQAIKKEKDKADRAAKREQAKQDTDAGVERTQLAIDLTGFVGHLEVLNTLMESTNNNIEKCGDDAKLRKHWEVYRAGLTALVKAAATN